MIFTMNKNWTASAEMVLKLHGDKLTDKELAVKLLEVGFITTHKCVAKKRQMMGIVKPKGTALLKRNEKEEKTVCEEESQLTTQSGGSQVR